MGRRSSVAPTLQTAERVQALWRRQVWLAGSAAVLGAAVLGPALWVTARAGRAPATELRLGRDGSIEIARPASEALSALRWPLAIGVVVLVAFLAVLIVHAVFAARLTFHPGGND